MRIPLLAGANEGISTNTSSQEAVNFFYEPPPTGEAHKGSMSPVHGAALFGTATNTGAIRGMLFDYNAGLLYVVADNDLYSVNSSAAFTARDVLATTGAGLVEMAHNPSTNEIMTVDGTTALIYDIDTTTGTDVTDVDFPDACTTVAYIDGYFLVNDPAVNGRFWFSDLNAGLNYTATNFETCNTLQSPIRKILVDRNDIWLFGDTEIELWYNSGDASNTFQRYEFINLGIAAKDTACVFDDKVTWLARTKRGELQVVQAVGQYQTQVISTPSLSRKWQEAGDGAGSSAYAYKIDGHEFYVIYIADDATTWAYDALTQMWHQRSAAFSSSVPTRYYPHMMVHTTWTGNMLIAGDFNATGKLWTLSNSVYTWDSANMERRLTGPTISSENEQRIRFSEVQIDVEEGTINVADTGNDRQLTLSWSKDGGHTYTTTGIQLNIGEAAVDGYTHRLMQRKLGKGRSWVFRIYSDTPRKLIVKGAYGRIHGEALGPV